MLLQRCTNPKCYPVTQVTKFCTLAPHIFSISTAFFSLYSQKCLSFHMHRAESARWSVQCYESLFLDSLMSPFWHLAFGGSSQILETCGSLCYTNFYTWLPTARCSGNQVLRLEIFCHNVLACSLSSIHFNIGILRIPTYKQVLPQSSPELHFIPCVYLKQNFKKVISVILRASLY